MLEKKDFKQGIEQLLMAFPNWSIDVTDPKVIETWYRYFKTIEVREFQNMINNYIMDEERQPTIAGVLKKHCYAGTPYVPASKIVEDRRKRLEEA